MKLLYDEIKKGYHCNPIRNLSMKKLLLINFYKFD